VTAHGTVIVGVDGSERARDALALGVALAGPEQRLLIAHVHPYEQLLTVLSEGDAENLLRETKDSILEDVREVVGDATKGRVSARVRSLAR
jgi:hypothetical protein